ncbi:hypothetical protein, partial [Pseudomonas viridiflava]|uniref:hypothetical protein n=1 Tax=Pseudomonas viridiflava TaxID=33069 RepID=UPI001BAEC439
YSPDVPLLAPRNRNQKISCRPNPAAQQKTGNQYGKELMKVRKWPLGNPHANNTQNKKTEKQITEHSKKQINDV